MHVMLLLLLDILDYVVMHYELICDALSTILRCPINYAVVSFELSRNAFSVIIYCGVALALQCTLLCLSRARSHDVTSWP